MKRNYITIGLVVLVLSSGIVTAQATAWVYTGTSESVTSDADGITYIPGGGFVTTTQSGDVIRKYDGSWVEQDSRSDLSIVKGADTGPEGNIYIPDSTTMREFDSNLNEVDTHALPVSSTQGVTYNSQNDTWYVIYFDGGTRIGELSNDFSTLYGSFEPAYTVRSLEWSNNNTLYVADDDSAHINELNGSTFALMNEYDISSETTSPRGMTQMPDGTLWLGDSAQTVYKYDGVPGPSPTTETTTLELDINRWMPRDSTQPYTVTLNKTNTTTGKTNLTDVTADANVTIYNITNTTGFSEPIATVNNTTDTIRSYNQTGLVVVNATYQGTTAGNGTNLTVGPRNLTNIGIMPPEQWPCSFLGCDQAPGGGDNPHNIGSSMQMLWLIIFIMIAATQMIENPWAGVGSGMLSGILFWVMEFIDLGTMLTIVFAGILVGLIMARTSMGRGVTRDNEFSGAAGRDKK